MRFIATILRSEMSETMNLEQSLQWKKIQVRSDFQRRFKYNGHTCVILDKIVEPITYAFKQPQDSGKCKFTFTAMCIVDEYNAMAIEHYRSQLAIDSEKIRHIKYYLFVFHPFSKIMTFWQNFMVLIYSMNLIYIPLYISTLHKEFKFFSYYSSITSSALEVFCLLDIILSFNIGFMHQTKNEVCLDRRKIVLNTFAGWFLFDILAWIPAEPIVYLIMGKNIVYTDVLLICRVRRMFILRRYLKNLMRRLSWSIKISRTVIIVLFTVLYLHWINSLQFSIVYLSEGSYSPENPDPKSWMSVLGVWDLDPSPQYFSGLFRAVLLATFQGLNMDSPQTLADQIFAAIVWVTSLALTTYFISIIIFTKNGEEYAVDRYHFMMSQLNIFMERKELSSELRHKLIHYYKIKHNDSYFREEKIFQFIPKVLLKELTMHTSRRVINNVPFLKLLSDDVLVEVVSSLRYRILLPDEVVIHVGALADSIFFILKGTVAVYSQTGYEAMHLFDGDYFGEISLIGGPRQQTQYVVAVSPCELLCLSAESFTKAVARHPELLNDMIRRASQQFERINSVGN